MRNFFLSLCAAFALVGAAHAAEPRTITFSSTQDLASAADAVGISTTVTVNNASLGDFCLASFSVSTVGMTVTCNVTATNTVIVRVQNESTATVDLASATMRVLLFKKPPNS